MSEYSIALEKQLEALNLCANLVRDKSGRRAVAEFDVLNLGVLTYAEPYFASAKICGLLEAAAPDLPNTVMTASDLFTPAGFVWFEKPLSLPEELEHLAGSDRLLALAWCAGRLDANGEVYIPASDQSADQVTIVPFPYYPQINSLIPAPMTMMAWPLGRSLQYVIDNAYDPTPGREKGMLQRSILNLKYFATAMALFGQQLLTTRKARAARATRHRAAAAWEMERLINVVELRRRSVAEGNHDEHETDWSCQWIVRGHWRNQWYPSAGRHQPVWVSPYVKGPEDKPLRPPRARIFAVVR